MRRRTFLAGVGAAGLAAATGAHVDLAAGSPTTHTVAWLGPSLARQAATGYAQLRNPRPDNLWVDYATGNGSVKNWALQPSYFSLFDGQIAANPPPLKVWWELAQHDSEGLNPTQLRAWAQTVYDGIRQRIPTAPIYCTSQPFYADATCPQCTNSPAAMATLRDQLVTDGLVFLGPEMPALTAVDVTAGGCDLAKPHKKVEGEILRGFFG